MERGIAWDSRIPALGPLTGFAHGNAGIAWALGELADLTGEARFRTAERAAVAYERSLFSAEAKNWPDLRDLRRPGADAGPTANPEASFMAAWCHGAAGIGLARILSLGRLDEPATRAEIEAALETTLARGFGDNHSLCHGDLGNLEPLLQAGERLADPRWRAEAASDGGRDARKHPQGRLDLRRPLRGGDAGADDRARRHRLRAAAPGGAGRTPSVLALSPQSGIRVRARVLYRRPCRTGDVPAGTVVDPTNSRSVALANALVGRTDRPAMKSGLLRISSSRMSDWMVAWINSGSFAAVVKRSGDVAFSHASVP